MIKQLTQIYLLSAQQQVELDDLKPFTRNTWESYDAKSIRDEIGSQLRNFQNGKCCYCGLNYDETGRGEIEHIAPKKSRPREYPDFSFEPFNLAIACQLCNSKTMKGEYNSIDNYNSNYPECTFKIVHPYFDDHSNHYKWTYGILNVLITGLTVKAQESIRLFKLAEEHRTTARAKQRNQERLIALYNLSRITIDKIKKVMNFKVI